MNSPDHSPQPIDIDSTNGCTNPHYPVQSTVLYSVLSRSCLEYGDRHRFGVHGELLDSPHNSSRRSRRYQVSTYPPGYLEGILTSSLIRLFRNIRHGRLTIRTPTQTYVFPEVLHSGNSAPELTAAMNIVDPVFWLRLCFMSDLGFAESYMFGEVECNNLIDVFSVSFISQLSTIIEH